VPDNIDFVPSGLCDCGLIIFISGLTAAQSMQANISASGTYMGVQASASVHYDWSDLFEENMQYAFWSSNDVCYYAVLQPND
jgi:hypothetical protein